MKNAKSLLLLFLLLPLGACSARLEHPVYYVQGEQLLVTDGDTTKLVFSAPDLDSHVGQAANNVFFYRRTGEDYLLYCYDGHDAVPFCQIENSRRGWRSQMGNASCPLTCGLSTLPVTECGMFCSFAAPNDDTNTGNRLSYITQQDTHARYLALVDVGACIPCGADVDCDRLYILSTGEDVSDHQRLWLWLTDLSRDTITTRLDVAVMLPDLQPGIYWMDGSTLWTDGSGVNPETACVQQWDPFTGELLAELPRYRDSHAIDTVTIHKGMIFFVEHDTLWLRSPGGALHPLLSLPEGTAPELYFGDTALVACYDSPDGPQAQYLSYPTD